MPLKRAAKRQICRWVNCDDDTPLSRRAIAGLRAPPSFALYAIARGWYTDEGVANFV